MAGPTNRPTRRVDPIRDNDFRLVRECQDPDSERFEEAFEALYTRYRDRVYSIAYRITGRSADAMDVMQESFSLLFRKIGGFRFNSRFSTWLFRIVVNSSIDHVRHEKSRNTRRLGGLSETPPSTDTADTAEGPRERAEQRELGDHVQGCITKLSPKLRAILVLRYVEPESTARDYDAVGCRRASRELGSRDHSCR